MDQSDFHGTWTHGMIDVFIPMGHEIPLDPISLILNITSMAINMCKYLLNRGFWGGVSY